MGGFHKDVISVGRGLAPAATNDLDYDDGGSKPPPYNKGYGHRISLQTIFALFITAEKPQKQKSRPNPNDFIKRS